MSKYNKILNDIQKCMEMGADLIEIEKDSLSSLLVVYVKDSKGIYYGYTVGEDNKDFLFDLIKFGLENGYSVKMKHLQELDTH